MNATCTFRLMYIVLHSQRLDIKFTHTIAGEVAYSYQRFVNYKTIQLPV